MSTLVVYASKHGATQGIAERIASTLNETGQEAKARPVEAAGDLTCYDAFVVGSAVYGAHWQKEASAFVQRNRAVLASKPVWLFSSGPLGTEATDAQGCCRPRCLHTRRQRSVTTSRQLSMTTAGL